jgi:hypothetical protein
VTFVLDPSRSTSNGVKVKEVTIGFSEATAGATNTPVIKNADARRAFNFMSIPHLIATIDWPKVVI